MCLKSSGFVILALLTSLSSGQPPAQPASDRVFHLAHTDGEQNFADIASLLRITADLSVASPDATQKTITVRGTPEQLGLAEWLFHEIDVARAHLIYDLRRELGTPEEVLPMLLGLLDQVYELRCNLKAMTRAIESQPAEVKAAVLGALRTDSRS